MTKEKYEDAIQDAQYAYVHRYADLQERYQRDRDNLDWSYEDKLRKLAIKEEGTSDLNYINWFFPYQLQPE